MTRCECEGVTFAEVAHRAQAEGIAPEQAIRRSGCGQLCEACLPDLRRFLAGR
jgi:bacterioferritin-associated ferredoxin